MPVEFESPCQSRIVVVGHTPPDAISMQLQKRTCEAPGPRQRDEKAGTTIHHQREQTHHGSLSTKGNRGFGFTKSFCNSTPRNNETSTPLWMAVGFLGSTFCFSRHKFEHFIHERHSGELGKPCYRAPLQIQGAKRRYTT